MSQYQQAILDFSDDPTMIQIWVFLNRIFTCKSCLGSKGLHSQSASNFVCEIGQLVLDPLRDR